MEPKKGLFDDSLGNFSGLVNLGSQLFTSGNNLPYCFQRVGFASAEVRLVLLKKREKFMATKDILQDVLFC